MLRIATAILLLGPISAQAATVTRETVVDRSMLEIAASMLNENNRGTFIKSTDSSLVQEVLDKGKMINRKGLIGIEFDNKRTITKCFRVLFWTRCVTFHCDEKIQITIPLESIKKLDWDNHWREILASHFLDDVAGLKIGYWLTARPNWLMSHTSVTAIVQGKNGKTSIQTWVTMRSCKRCIRRHLCSSCHALTNRIHGSFLQMMTKVPERNDSKLAIISLLSKVIDADHSKDTSPNSGNKEKLPTSR